MARGAGVRLCREPHLAAPPIAPHRTALPPSGRGGGGALDGGDREGGESVWSLGREADREEGLREGGGRAGRERGGEGGGLAGRERLQMAEAGGDSMDGGRFWIYSIC